MKKNIKKEKIMLKHALSGKFGNRVTLDYVFDEAITATWSRTKDMRKVKAVYTLFFGDKSIAQVKKFPLWYIPETWDVFQKYVTKRKLLSFTDCAQIYYASSNKINKIVSFDDEFDGIIQRIT